MFESDYEYLKKRADEGAEKRQREQKEKGFDYEKYFSQGLFTKVRTSRFDSNSERIVCNILNSIMDDYGFSEYMDLRLMPQQPVDLYVESKDEQFHDFQTNRHKWMRFDFLFENVYRSNGFYHYVPVAVVEFDGPFHGEEKQKRLDAYKDGVARNIGASMIRIRYDMLSGLTEEAVREMYEDDIITGIIRGYFTKTENFRKTQELINENNQWLFDKVVTCYTKALERETDLHKKELYTDFLCLLFYSKEALMSMSN